MAKNIKKGIIDTMNIPSNVQEMLDALDLNDSLSEEDKSRMKSNILNSEFADELDIDSNNDTDEISDEIDSPDESDDNMMDTVFLAMNKLKEMRTQLKDIPDISSRKKLLNKLADKAEDCFSDVVDKAFNTEDKYAAGLIKAATSALQLALDAHKEVLSSDIKLVELQLKKDKMEFDLNKLSSMKMLGNKDMGNDSLTPIQDLSTENFNRNDLLRKK